MRPRRARAAALAAGLAAALALGCATRERPDPIEPVNRPIFAFNEGADRWVLEPVAEGWDFVLPELVQQGIWNFYRNLEMPMVFLNDLLQAKPVPAGWDLSRFAVNTTVGVLGFVDVASELDIPHHDEDFGQTLGRYGVPPGAYLVLPLLGPFTVRDLLAYPVDLAAQPQRWLVQEAWIRAAVGVPDLINTRARYLEEVRESRRMAFDYYIFLRNAYLQRRRRLVEDAVRTAPEGPPDASDATPEGDDLYYPDEEEDERPPADGAPPEDSEGSEGSGGAGASAPPDDARAPGAR